MSCPPGGGSRARSVSVPACLIGVLIAVAIDCLQKEFITTKSDSSESWDSSTKSSFSLDTPACRRSLLRGRNPNHCKLAEKETQNDYYDKCNKVRSSHLRQDGGLCFEIPPWQHQPVELEQHLERLRPLLANATSRKQMHTRLALVNSEVSRYMDTVLAPFLDAYHRNIQNSYQQLTSKILRRIKDEINIAVQKKQLIYTELSKLADELKIPPMCDEERRSARTLASQHVATIYKCIEEARQSIAKMGPYAEEMISITRQHMQIRLDEASRSLDQGNGNINKDDIPNCLRELSRAAANLGYELDLSVTNSRRHSEQSCERLAMCSSRARKRTDELVTSLREQLYQCVYA